MKSFIYFKSLNSSLTINICLMKQYNPGPSCSKLMTSLVNESLKFTPSDTQICWNFLLKSAKTVKEMTLNELLKLTTLWTTGPSLIPESKKILFFFIMLYLIDMFPTIIFEDLYSNKPPIEDYPLDCKFAEIMPI